MIQKSGNRLVYTYDSEKLWIEPWGENALRIRSTKLSEMPCEDWALSEPAPAIQAEILIDAGKKTGSIRNGKIFATVSRGGKIVVCNQHGEILLEEYQRTRSDEKDPKCCAIEIEAREFKGNPGGDYTNIRLPFLPPSREALGEHGRIGTVIPAELFQIDCAAKARNCLGSRFDRLTIKAGIGCSPAGSCFHSRSFSGSRNRENRTASFGKQKGRAAAQYKGIAGNDCSE